MIDTRKLNFSQHQLERFRFLCGPRYKGHPYLIKLTLRRHKSWEENVVQLLDNIKVMYLESLRAPLTDPRLDHSPSFRNRHKRMMGKTKAEREQFIINEE